MQYFKKLFTRQSGTSAIRLTPADYQRDFTAVKQDHLLVDVRSPQEFASGHIRGAVNLPLQELDHRLREIPLAKPVIVYCRSGVRSAQAAQFLQKANYSQTYDLGGIMVWQAQGFPVE